MNDLGHGQVWWADLDKVRPVLILTRATVAPVLTRVVVAPITTASRGIPTEVELGPSEGVAEGSVASFDNIQLVPVGLLLEMAGEVHPTRWTQCCDAVAHMMGC